MARGSSSRRKKVRQAENAASNISNAASRRQKQPRMTTAGGISTVTGSEIVGNVNSMGGAVVAVVDTDPALLTGSWLNRQATLYNHYRYTRCCLRYVPFVPTSQMGRLIMSWCGDFGQTVTANATYVSQFANAVEVPIWREASCNFVMPRTPEFTYTSNGTENEAQSPGKFVVYTDYGTGSTNVAMGSLYLEYTVQFWARSPYVSN